jgi:hypothetical protein
MVQLKGTHKIPADRGCEAADEPVQAKEAWEQALAIFEELQHPGADSVRAKLADTKDHGAANPPA